MDQCPNFAQSNHALLCLLVPGTFFLFLLHSFTAISEYLSSLLLLLGHVDMSIIGQIVLK